MSWVLKNIFRSQNNRIKFKFTKVVKREEKKNPLVHAALRCLFNKLHIREISRPFFFFIEFHRTLIFTTRSSLI